MKRLLKFAARAFLLVTLLMPLLECFDTWDRPGLANDTELPVFLVILFVTLTLLVASLLAGRAISLQNALARLQTGYEPLYASLRVWRPVVVPPLVSPPLRI